MLNQILKTVDWWFPTTLMLAGWIQIYIVFPDTLFYAGLLFIFLLYMSSYVLMIKKAREV